MKKVKIGVLGAYRGFSMINFCSLYPNAELVAICDKSDEVLLDCQEKLKKLNTNCNPKFYKDFDEFINHDMDAVVLANYATEHAPFAIKCLNKGLHVMSEVLPCQTLKEAVELVDAVENSKKIYSYAENYCYMPANSEMRKLFMDGTLGEFQYGEGEYIHDCHEIWPDITYGDENHWRNNIYSTFYCTHSIGPLIHISRLRPISVVGFELPMQERMINLGCKGGLGTLGIELITLENGAVLKSVHGCGLYRRPGSVWYSVYGKKGCAESNRWTETAQEITTSIEGNENNHYLPKPLNNSELSKEMSGHGGCDFYTTYYFVESILGNSEGLSNMIDVYEALDMFLPGLFAYKSIIEGNIKMDIPNFRIKEERDKYRNDTFCSDKNIANDMYVYPHSSGEIKINKKIYEEVNKEYKRRKGH